MVKGGLTFHKVSIQLIASIKRDFANNSDVSSQLSHAVSIQLIASIKRDI